MSEFLTVKEAAALTGKSPSSIRRIIYPIIQDAKHPDRVQIEPTPDEALSLRMKGEVFAWRVSEELLRRVIPPETPSEKGAGTVPERNHGEGSGALLAMLQRELTIKNDQIKQQSEMLSQQITLISGLSERLREGNILIGQLQQQLALTDGREHQATEPVEAVPARPPEPEKTAKQTASKQAASKTTKAKPKRGFLFQLFR